MWWNNILTWASNCIDQCHGNITFSEWLTRQPNYSILLSAHYINVMVMSAYNTLVRPLLEYASIAWDPYQQYLNESIERIQHRASRWVAEDYRMMSSVTAMLSELGWTSLKQHRQDSRLIIFFKIVN